MPSASDLVAEQGQLVRRLKTEKAGREEIQEAVQKLKVIREVIHEKNLLSFGHCPNSPHHFLDILDHFLTKMSKNIGAVQTFLDMGLTPPPKRTMSKTKQIVYVNDFPN